MFFSWNQDLRLASHTDLTGSKFDLLWRPKKYVSVPGRWLGMGVDLKVLVYRLRYQVPPRQVLDGVATELFFPPEVLRSGYCPSAT